MKSTYSLRTRTRGKLSAVLALSLAVAGAYPSIARGTDLNVANNTTVTIPASITYGTIFIGNTSNGTVVQSASNVIVTATTGIILGAGNGTGTYNLSAGVLITKSITSQQGTGGYMLFNGGTVEPYADDTQFSASSPASVLQGAAIFNTSGFTLNEGLQLNHGTGSAVDGGLVKNGAGTLILQANNTYNGPTLISAGTLEEQPFGGISGLGVNSAVTLANVAGVTLDLEGNDATIGSLTGGGPTGGTIQLLDDTLSIGSNNTSTGYAGTIAGQGSVTKIGTGTLTLYGTSTFSGALNVNTGVLSFGESNLISQVSSLTLANAASAVVNLNGQNESVNELTGGGSTGGNVNLAGGTLTVGNSNDTAFSYSGTITGTSTLVKVGSDNFTLSAAQPFNGSLTVNGGAMTFTGASSLGNVNAGILTVGGTTGAVGTLNINTSGTLEFSGAGNTPIGVIGATGFISQTSGTLNLTNAGTGQGGYLEIGEGGSGTYVMSGGSLIAYGTTTNTTVGVRIGDTGTGSFLQSQGSTNVGRYFVVGNGTGVGQATFTGGTASLGSFGYRVIVADGTSGSTGTLNIGTLAGGSAVVTVSADTGSGIVVGGGTGDTGTLNLNSGTLILGGAATGVTIAGTAGATGTVNFNGITLKPATAGLTLATSGSNLTTYVYNGGVTVNTNGFNATLAASLTAPAGNGLYPSGGLILPGNGLEGSLTGTPVVTSVVDFGSPGLGLTAIPDMSGTTLVGFYLTSAGQDVNVGDTIQFTYTGAGVNTYAGYATSNYTVKASDLAANGQGALTKTGAGTLLLTEPDNAGALIVNAGSVQAGVVNAFGSNTTVSLAAGTTMDLNGYNQSFSSLSFGAATGTITLGSATLSIISSSNTTIPVNISGTGAVIEAGSGILTLSGTNTFTGGATLSSGTLDLDSAAALGTSGTILFNGGTLQYSSANQTDYSSRFSTAANQSFNIDNNGQSVTFASSLNSSGGSLTEAGSGSLTLSAPAKLSGITVNGGSLTLTASNNSVGAVTINGTTLAISGSNTTAGTLIDNGGTLTLAGSNNSVGAITLNGGTMSLGGATAVNGSITINDGTLHATGNGAFGTTSAVTLANNSDVVLDLNNTNQTIGSLTGGSSSTVTLGSQTLTVGAASTSTEMDGLISGTGGLVKNGSGTLTLTNSNTYTGGTNISGGTVFASNSTSLGTGSVKLNNGQLQLAGGIPGFNYYENGDFSAFKLNGASTITENGLMLNASSAFYNTKLVFSNGFNETFYYIDSAPDVAFVLQNDPRGSSASSPYTTNSLEVQFTSNAVSLLVDGNTVNSQSYTNIVGLSEVTVIYNASTQTITSTVGLRSNVQTFTFPDVSLATILGSTGYFGYDGTNTIQVEEMLLPYTASTQIANPIAVAFGQSNKLSIANVLAAPAATVGAITLSANAKLALVSSTGTTAVLGTPSLAVGSGASLDVASNDLDITGMSLPSVNALVAAGFNNAAWNGAGIISSSAASNSTHLTTLGVMQNNQSGSAIFTALNLFDGAIPGAGDVLVKYTYFGDANLDGKVDASDYSLIDSGYVTHATGWHNGDFNYDGVINGSDYTLIDNSFNTQGAAISAEFASSTAQIAATTDTSAVPEPATISSLMIGTLSLLSRRTRRRRD